MGRRPAGSALLWPIFQSTHPVRGGTVLFDEVRENPGISIHPPRAGWDSPEPVQASPRPISIHPPRAGWDIRPIGSSAAFHISIHPPRAGWDPVKRSKPLSRGIFQSTHPVRGGTLLLWTSLVRLVDFNPPTPCGVGHEGLCLVVVLLLFQSTHPVRGGTPWSQ